MTSEILVMNQRAMALAADSAVTMFDGGKVIVRNDQKKLFNLAEGLPVGVMFFGAADLMGHPWDVLVEHFRVRAAPQAQAHIRDYAESLFACLDGLESFFPAARQDDEYKRLIASVHRFIFRYAHYMVESGDEGPDEAILEEAIERVWLRYQAYSDGRPRKDLDCFPPGFGARIGREYADLIDDMTGYSFAAFSLTLQARKRLREIAVYAVVKDLFLEDVTGLVFGGYGTEEPYPVVVTYNVSAVICGIVKRARLDETRIDGDMHAAISLYADSEASYAFLRGIDIGLEARVYGTFHTAAGQLVDTVMGGLGDIDPVRREAVRREAQSEHVPQAVQECYDAINAYQQQAFIDPVLAVVEISTRQDLAETAHDLVALNIFRKRITAQDPTVGGAIDVAVISRDAGFKWWKRQGDRL
jgi:hypothetical protein